MLLVSETARPGRNGYTASVVGDGAVSEALLNAWSELAAIASEPNAFAEPWFVIPALRHLRKGRDVRLVEVRDGADGLAGVIALTLYGRYGRIPVRHVSNWTHYQCFMGTPLIRAGDEASFWQAVIALLDTSEWTRGFLSISGLCAGEAVHRGIEAAVLALGRPSPVVHRYSRAALASQLEPEAYLEAAVRGKKRKELRRQTNRLAELGKVEFSVLAQAEQIEGWCDVFLSLEAAGWKGQSGSAFARDPETEAFFRACVGGAFDAGKLDFQRIDLDGQAIAMLVNFRTPPGSWSFKIAYDENFARFSPGVLIELENLKRVLTDPAVDWMDSCAVEDHPMINSLWMERREIVQVAVPLSGWRRRALFRACRTAEKTSALLRKMTS